jgi:hypothetical protein
MPKPKRTMRKNHQFVIERIGYKDGIVEYVDMRCLHCFLPMFCRDVSIHHGDGPNVAPRLLEMNECKGLPKNPHHG